MGQLTNVVQSEFERESVRLELLEGGERRTHRAKSSNPSSRPASNAVEPSCPPVVEDADEDDVEAMDESDDLLWASCWAAAALRLARIWDSRDSRGAVGVLGPDLRNVEKRPMWCRLGRMTGGF